MKKNSFLVSYRVVHQDDDRVQAVPHHRRDVLRRHLERTVADRRHDPSALRARNRLGRRRASGRGGRAARRADRPPDRAVLQLELVPAPFGELQLQAVEPRVARLGDDEALGVDEALEALIEDVGDQGVVGRGLAEGALRHEHALVVLLFVD